MEKGYHKKGERGKVVAPKKRYFKQDQVKVGKVCTKGRGTTSTFFVPPSRNSNLYKFVMECEDSLRHVGGLKY